MRTKEETTIAPIQNGAALDAQIRALSESSEVWRLVEESRNKLIEANGKRLILLVGSTGAGKSTLINYLNGSRLEYAPLPNDKNGELFLQVQNGQTVYAEIGHNPRRSKTLHPHAIPAVYNTVVDPVLRYIDLPGSNDAHLSEAERLCASMALPMTIHYAQAISGIIVVIDVRSFSTRGNAFIDFMGLLGGLLDRSILATESLRSPLMFVFTHVNPRQFRTVEAILAHIDRLRNERIEEISPITQDLMTSLHVLATKLGQTQELLVILERLKRLPQSPEDASMTYESFFRSVEKLLKAYRSSLPVDNAEYQNAEKHYNNLNNSYYELIAMSIVLKYKNNPDNQFIIDGEGNDHRLRLINHIQRIRQLPPIDKNCFVFQGNAGKEWLQLNEVLQTTSERASLLQQLLGEYQTEVANIKKYHDFFKKRQSEHMLILSKPDSERKPAEILRELSEEATVFATYLTQSLEDTKQEQRKVQEKLDELNTAAPLRYFHPSLGPIDLSVSKFRKGSLLTAALLSDLVIIAPVLVTTMLGGIALGIAALINKMKGKPTSVNEVTASVIPAVTLGAPVLPMVKNAFGIWHDFNYHDIPFLWAELWPNRSTQKNIAFSEVQKLELQKESAAVNGLLKFGINNLLSEVQEELFDGGTFYTDTQREDKERGIFEISCRFDCPDVQIKLFVEQRLHPDVTPQIKLLKQKLEQLQYATSNYFQEHLADLKADLAALKACHTASDPKAALITLLTQRVSQFPSRENKLNQYMQHLQTNISKIRQAWHTDVMSRLENMKMIYEIIGSQRRFVKKFLEDAPAFSKKDSLNALIEKHPTLKTADEWCNSGRDYLLRRNSDSNAIACFELALSLDEKHTETLYQLGMFFQYRHADLTQAKVYFERAVQQNHELSRRQLLIIKDPKLNGLRDPNAQIYIAELKLKLYKLTSHYPWIRDANFSPNLIEQDLIALHEDLETYYEEFARIYKDFASSYEERVRIVQNLPSTTTASNYRLLHNQLVVSAQALWKCFEKYCLQIITWPVALSGLPARQKEIEAIDGFLTSFEQKLGELSDLVMKIPAELGGRSHFFSAGRFLSTLSNRYRNPDHRASQISEKIQDIQKIVSNPYASERVSMGLLIALIREMQVQEIDPNFLTLLCNAQNYSVCVNPCDAEELRSFTEHEHLPLILR